MLAILIFYFPESPFWLAKKERHAEALKSLKRLRTNSSNCIEELNRIIEQIKRAHESIEDDDESIIKSETDNNNENRSVQMINESIINFDKKIDNFNLNSTDNQIDDCNHSINDKNRKPYKSTDKLNLPTADTSTKSSFLRDLRLPHVYKPLIFFLIIMFYQQMSGANGLFGSLQIILNSAKFNQLTENQAAVLGMWVHLEINYYLMIG